MKNTFIGRSDGKNLDFGSEANRFRLQQDIKEHPNAVYRLERQVPKRTNSQNNFFWMYLQIIEESTGNSSADMHEYVKKYLTPKVERSVKVLKDGKWAEHRGMAGKGTSELTKTEMADVLDRLCALTGVPLPNPEDAGYILN